MPIFHCAEGEKRWQKSEVFISEKLQPDAGPDAVQGGPVRLVSSNRTQTRAREGHGLARPVPRGTGASSQTPIGAVHDEELIGRAACPVTMGAL
jgi:hypothetical protein